MYVAFTQVQCAVHKRPYVVYNVYVSPTAYLVASLHSRHQIFTVLPVSQNFSLFSF